MAAFRLILKGTAVIAGIIFLSSCSHIGQLNKHKLQQSADFERELAREYQEFANSEAQQYDWIDADFFAKKGLKSLAGKRPEPEKPSEWREPADKLPELTQSRQTLVGLLTAENKRQKPTELAKAQAYYDCWVEQQEENRQPGDIATCKDKFLDTISSLSQKGSEPYLVIKHDIVYFEYGESKLDNDAKHTIDSLATIAKASASYRVNLSGYADKSGADDHNKVLANRRVNAVKQELINKKVPAGHIVTKAFGESRPKVPTADGVKERGNRRVEIYVVE